MVQVQCSSDAVQCDSGAAIQVWCSAVWYGAVLSGVVQVWCDSGVVQCDSGAV